MLISCQLKTTKDQSHSTLHTLEKSDTVISEIKYDSSQAIQKELDDENQNPFVDFNQTVESSFLYDTVEEKYFSKFSIRFPDLQIHKKEKLNNSKCEMFGLFTTASGDYLKKVWVDTILSSDAVGEYTNTRVYLENKEDHWNNLKFLIDSKDGLFSSRKLPKLITTAMFEEKPDTWLHTSPKQIDSVWINFDNGNRYAVEYLTEVIFYDGAPYKRLKVIHDLTNKTKSHKLKKILWLGDLDGDGKLDIIEDRMHDIGGVYDIYLHLSSQATKEELIKTVAKKFQPGC